MTNINEMSNGIEVTVGAHDDICEVYARLRKDLWEVRNQYYTHSVDSFSEFNRDFNRSNINEFINSLTATGKYTQINVSYVSAN